jgi:hypothetical protein
MSGTTTRPRRPGGYGAYVSGANALQVDDDETLAPEQLAPPRPTTAVPRPRRARRTPWITPVAEPSVEPAALPISLPRTPFLALVVGVVVVGVLGVLVLNTKINENSFRLNDLRATQAALDLQEQQLAQNLAELESPGNLRAAATRLGLVPAGTPAYISLPDGRVVGVPQPASGR